MQNKPDKSEVASLSKAFQVLEYLSQLNGDISLKELSIKLGMPKTTLVRLLATLKSHCAIQQDPVSKNYQLGWALIYMGASASRVFSLPKIIHPYLERLAQETGESASLVQFQRDSAVYVDQVSCNNLIRSGLGIGAQLHLHASAAGKILISAFSDYEILQFVERHPLVMHTVNTIIDPNTFLETIERARKNGYALDDEEGELGARCIAAPVHDWNNNIVAAISITGPTSRITRQAMPRLINNVRGIALEASKALTPGEADKALESDGNA